MAALPLSSQCYAVPEFKETGAIEQTPRDKDLAGTNDYQYLLLPGSSQLKLSK